MKTLVASSVALLLFACGDATPPDPTDDADAGPAPTGPFARCLTGERTLQPAWTVGNQHGAIVSLVTSGDLILVGSEDGSVKQWLIGPGGALEPPNYGDPLDESDPAIPGELAATGALLAAADWAGGLRTWTLPDVVPGPTLSISQNPLVALALSHDGATAVVADTAFGGDLRLVPLAGGEPTGPLLTELWDVEALLVAPSGDVFAAGAVYGQAAVERRAAADLETPVDIWVDGDSTGGVFAIAADADAGLLVAVGFGFVATLAPHALADGPIAFTDTGERRSIDVDLVGTEAFATVDDDGRVRLWSVEGVAEKASFEAPGASAAAFVAAHELIVVVDEEARVRALACR